MKPFWLFAKILVTGGAVLALELAASRILTPFFGVSLYVWSAILSVTLIALALGYKFGGDLTRRLDKRRALLLYSAAGALAGLWLNLCVWTYPLLFRPLSDFSLVGGSILACLYLLFVPLVILSALNPLLVLLLAEDQKGDAGAGRVFFVSTIGSVLGVFAAAFGLMPYLTNYQTVVVLAVFLSTVSLFLLCMMRDFRAPDFRAVFAVSAVSLVIGMATLFSGGLERVEGPIMFNNMQWRIVHTQPSFFGQLQIVDIQTGNGATRRNLFNDGLMQNQFGPGGQSSTLYTYALERLALAAAHKPQKALVLGAGAGVIPAAFAEAGIDVHAVDINPAIVKISRDYLGFDPSSISIAYEDARMSARHCTRDYDIVAVDLFRGDGIPEHLSTREFFADVHACLKPGGVMVMNSFMHVTDPKAEYALVKTIGTVFGDVAFIARRPRHNPDFTVAFIVTRKDAEIGPLRPDLENMPPLMRSQLAEAMTDLRIITPDDAQMQDYPVLTDISNQWKHLAYSSELAYRRSIASQLPWQILMN